MNISEEMSPVADWWKKEGKRAVMILCIGGLIALGAYAWVSRERRLDAEAAVYAYGVNPYTIQELEDAVQKYGDRDVGAVIKMRLAKMYYQGAEFEKALEIFKAVADGDVYTVFALAPKFGIAHCEEALENWGEAQKAYDEIAETEGGESMYGFNAKLGSARCYALAHIGEEGRFEKLEAIRKECENDVEKRNAVDMMMAVLRNYDPKREYVSKEADTGAPAEVTEAKTETPAAEEKAKAPVKAEKAPAEAKNADDKKPAAQPAKAK